MQELVASLSMWIGSHSTLPPSSGLHPAVSLAPTSALIEIMYRGNVPNGVDRRGMRVVGLYQFEQNVIYLRQDTDLQTVEGRALLVHELVHFLQFENGMRERVRCKQELEPIAYELQQLYLAENGGRNPFSERHLRRVGSC